VSFRVLIAGISHETNTYCKDLTRRGEFYELRGERALRALRGTRTDVGGMLRACEELGASVVPGLVAGASPSGTIEAATYAALKQEILDDIHRAGALDAVALALHGAGVAEGIDDLEADLVESVRALAGDRLRLVATFDLHGNVTERMAEGLDLMFGCHEYPHVDMDERGVEAIRAIPRLLAGEISPVHAVETVPVLLPTTTTLFGPGQRIRDHCLSLEARPGVIDCTFFHGFPYTDTPLVGSHISATADGDRALAREIARAGAQALWEARESFRVESISPAQAIERALAVEGGPVVINETSDNPGGGTPGDGTHLLRAMVEAGLESACFGCICDPEAAEAAHRAGVGATLEIALGGRYDELHGAPLPVRAYVKSLTDGRFVWQAMAAGTRANLGKMARLLVGGIDVLVSSRRTQTFDDEMFRLHGIDVRRYKIVALKSSNHFRAGFQQLARAIVTTDPPGLTTHQIQIFPRKRAPGPLWPLDPAARFP
jgi:microcystin degradation protein MlrC